MTKLYTLDRVVRLVIGVVIFIGVFLLVKKLSSVLLPFLIGWLIAYLMHPLVMFVQIKMRVKNRVVSIIISLIAVIIFFGGLIMAVVPAIGTEFSRFGLLVSQYAEKIGSNGEIPHFLHQIWNYLIGDIDFKTWLSLDNIESVTQKVLPGFWNLLSSTWQIIVGIFVVFMILLYVIFILKDYEKISSGFVSLIPPKYRGFVEKLVQDVQVSMNRYFRGQGLIAFIVGILFAAGFAIVGIPLGIVIGLFMGVLNLVPYMQTLGFIPLLLMCLLKSAETGHNFWWILLTVAIVFIIVQATQDLFLTPKIMGKAMGLNPAIILLSLSIWGALLGLVGMIIALPMTTLAISYYKHYVIKEDDEAFLQIQKVENENNLTS